MGSNTDKFAIERKKFPVLREQAYLETSGTGLVPDYVYDGIKHYQDGRYLVGGDADWGGYGTVKMLSDSRMALAGMLGCSKDDIAFGSNSSQMMCLFIDGIDLKAGDNVIMSEQVFFGQIYGWHYARQKGVEIKYVKPDHGMVTLDMIKAVADKNTRVVSLDLVENSTGYLISAEEIGKWCRENGIWFITDAAQGAGAVKIDVGRMNIDFLAGSDYKWMMNYGGTGYAYISPKARKALKKTSAGWMSEVSIFSEKLPPDISRTATRFEYGYPNVSGIYGIGKVAERYMELGKDDIHRYILSLNHYLEEKVRDIDGVTFWSDFPEENRSGIMILVLDDTVKATNEDFVRAKVKAHISSGELYGAKRAMRISVHYYNDTTDIDRLVEVLKKR